jgi:hypothetical protein
MSDDDDYSDDDAGEEEEEGSCEGEESEEDSDEAKGPEREVVSSKNETKATKHEKLLKRFNAFVDEHRGKSWIKDNLPLVLEEAVQKIVAAANGTVHAPSLALPLIRMTEKKNLRNILPLRVAIRSATYDRYIKGWKGDVPPAREMTHYNSCRDFYMRSINDPDKYGPERYPFWIAAVSKLTADWQKFFKIHVFPLLGIRDPKVTATETPSIPQRKRRKAENAQDESNAADIYTLDPAARNQFLRYHLSESLEMPKVLKQPSRAATEADLADFLHLGPLVPPSKGEPRQAGECSAHPGRHVTLFDANPILPRELQKKFAGLLERTGVHNHNDRLMAAIAPKDKLVMNPVWAYSTLNKKRAREDGVWTDVESQPTYLPTRLHVPYENFSIFAESASAEDQATISKVLSASDDIYSAVYDSIIAGDHNMADVTNTLTKSEFSTLISRNMPADDAFKIAKGTFKFPRGVGKKFYQWKEPAADKEVLETGMQTMHMDVQDGKGGSVVVSVDAPQSIDIVPDSALGIEVLDSDLIPVFDDAMEYYEKEVHADWLAWRAKPDSDQDNLACGKASFWSFVVDRHFQRRGVKRFWERITLTLEPGHGVFLSNKMLHAGARHSGRAVNRIHMYMSEQGLLSQGVADPEVSEIVYDFRTDKHMFVLARYLAAEPGETIEMTRSAARVTLLT